MSRPPLHIDVLPQDQAALAQLLRGRIQPVRVVMRALGLWQFSLRASAPHIATLVPLTFRAIRQIGNRYRPNGPERPDTKFPKFPDTKFPKFPLTPSFTHTKFHPTPSFTKFHPQRTSDRDARRLNAQEPRQAEPTSIGQRFLVQVRYSQRMIRILDRAAITAGRAESRISFVTEGGGAWKVWDRFLTVDGKKAYHLGNICQTCEFLFQRLDGANTSINIETAVDALASGVRTVSDAVVTQLAAGLPTDEYLVCLSEATLQLVVPGEPEDYFVKEQVALWGMDQFWNLPHDPRVAYYRASEANLGNGVKLFDFVIPMFPENWLDKKIISDYVERFEAGGAPCAVAISLLDVKGPADWLGEIDPTEHWIFSHFLIDGHHKVCAAHQTGRPIRLLTFISFTHGVSTKEQIEKAVTASAD